MDAEKSWQEFCDRVLQDELPGAIRDQLKLFFIDGYAAAIRDHSQLLADLTVGKITRNDYDKKKRAFIAYLRNTKPANRDRTIP